MGLAGALRSDLYRIIHSVLFGSVFLLLHVYILVHVIMDVLPVSKCILGAEYPETVFRYWIGMDFSSGFSVGYYMIVPGIAALVPGAIYIYEKRNGYMNQLVVESGRKEACLAKLFSSFLAGGVLAAFPVLSDYLIISTMLPSVRPIAATFFYTVNGDDFLSELFYEHSTIYVLLRILIVFVMVGAFSTICFMSEKLIDNEYAAMVFPFAVFMGLHIIFTYSGQGAYSPYNMLCPGNSNGVTWLGIVLLSGILFVIGTLFALIEVQRYEV